MKRQATTLTTKRKEKRMATTLALTLASRSNLNLDPHSSLHLTLLDLPEPLLHYIQTFNGQREKIYFKVLSKFMFSLLRYVPVPLRPWREHFISKQVFYKLHMRCTGQHPLLPFLQNHQEVAGAVMTHGILCYAHTCISCFHMLPLDTPTLPAMVLQRTHPQRFETLLQQVDPFLPAKDHPSCAFSFEKKESSEMAYVLEVFRWHGETEYRKTTHLVCSETCAENLINAMFSRAHLPLSVILTTFRANTPTSDGPENDRLVIFGHRTFYLGNNVRLGGGCVDSRFLMTYFELQLRRNVPATRTLKISFPFMTRVDLDEVATKVSLDYFNAVVGGRKKHVDRNEPFFVQTFNTNLWIKTLQTPRQMASIPTPFPLILEYHFLPPGVMANQNNNDFPLFYNAIYPIFFDITFDRTWNIEARPKIGHHPSTLVQIGFARNLFLNFKSTYGDCIRKLTVRYVHSETFSHSQYVFYTQRDKPTPWEEVMGHTLIVIDSPEYDDDILFANEELTDGENVDEEHEPNPLIEDFL